MLGALTRPSSLFEIQQAPKERAKVLEKSKLREFRAPLEELFQT